MPYQDVDDIEVVEAARSPSVLGRWLRKAFVEDWSMKLIALGITLVLWLAVADFNKPRTIRTAVQLNFLRPHNLHISNELPRTVDVELTGSRESLNSLQFPDLVATVDISDNQAGERVVRLLTERVRMELPAGVKIESFNPASLAIRLEPNLERRLPVEIKLEGQPAAGYETLSSKAQPSMISVRGPASLVENLKQAPTETVSIEGRKENFTVARVAIDIPDQRIDLLDPTVDVTIEIGEKKAPGIAPLSSTHGLDGPLVAARVGRYSKRSNHPNSQ